MDGSVAVQFNKQGRAGKGALSGAGRASTRDGRGAGGSRVVAAVESMFVQYLPQDDAVVAGLGEREGGVDASETQEVTDLLNEQLSTLLRLPSREFWKEVVTDKSLSVFLDSYLRFRRRWFDNPWGSHNGSNVSVVAGDGDLSRRAFMVLLRMSSNHDPGTPAREILSASEHAVILQERKLLDIPKLMDISAIYGHDNPDLTRRLVSNVFKAQPRYCEELSDYIPPLLERIITMHERSSSTIEAITNQRDSDTLALGDSHVHQDLPQIVDFMSDTVITLKAFVRAYPPAAAILVAGNLVSGQGLFLSVLATVHDTLLPVLMEGFKVLKGSAKTKQLVPPNLGGQQMESNVTAQDRLHKLGEMLVDLSWQLIKYGYLAEFSGEMTMTGAEISSKSYRDAVWKGDSLLLSIVALAMGPSDDDAISRELGSSVTRLPCTGALLQTMDRRYGLHSQIREACLQGAVVLDEAQQDYLSAVMADNKLMNGLKSNPLLNNNENFPLLTPPEAEVEEETMIQQSKISQIKDLFPEYGDGFIAACLEAYDNDPEKVIERILDKTLHSDLLLLDTLLASKPDNTAQVVNGKGKGKVNEQIVSNKSRSNSEERSSLAQESGPSSSFAGDSGVGSGHPEGIQPKEQASKHPGPKVGRYVRRQKGDAPLTELLDSRNGNRELRAAIRAAAARIEYEDEYDDSFDDLGGYVADAGGNAETESLADEVGRRSGVQDQHVRLGNNRPVVLTPWGSSTTKSRAHSAVSSRTSFEQQKSSVVVPEVEGQAHDTPSTDLLAGQGRGGRSGRGRRKWKEQGPKPQFYMKEGKLYSYKVAGAVGVSSIEEADAIKQDQAENIHGLGAGGNVPVQAQDTSAGGRKTNDSEEDSKFGEPGSRQNSDLSGDGGRGRGRNSRGRGAPGRGSYIRKDNDNHHRKESAMKKHFGGLGHA